MKPATIISSRCAHRSLARLSLRQAASIFFGTALCFVSLSQARADAAPRQIESLVFTCYTCHGPEGNSRGEIPSLTGLSDDEIREKLLDFRQDLHSPTIMNRISKAYSESEIDRIADYLADQ